MSKFSIIKEFFEFVKVNKKWLVISMISFLILVGILIAVTQGSALAPFIYNLF